MTGHEYLKLHEPDEGWWFHLGRQYGALRVQYPSDAHAAVAGVVLEQSPRNDAWWWGPADTDAVVVVTNHRQPLPSYVLADETMESAGLPLRLTADQWNALEEDGPVQALYQREFGEPVEKFTDLDLSGAPDLNGTPKDRSLIPAGSTWSPKLPFELRYHNEYSHLFPGTLNNFREATKTALSALPGVDAYDESGSGGLKGWVRVAYPDLFSGMPQRMKPKSPRSKIKVPDLSTPFTSLHWSLSCGNAIEGSNLAEARARWDEKLAGYVAWFSAVQRRAEEIVAQLPVPSVEVPEAPAGLKLRRD